MVDEQNRGPSFGAGAYATPLTPAQQAEWKQRIIDDEQLRLLRIGFFISAGQTALLIPFGLLYAGMAVLFTTLPSSAGSPPPPPEMSWIFGALGGGLAVLGTLATALKLLTAVRLKERRSRVLCLVSATLCFIEIPYGTALGLMAFVVLGRASVRAQFDHVIA